MNNIILDFEKLIEGRARHLAKEKKYKGKITPSSNMSIFCTHQYVTKFEFEDVMNQLFK